MGENFDPTPGGDTGQAPINESPEEKLAKVERFCQDYGLLPEERESAIQYLAHFPESSVHVEGRRPDQKLTIQRPVGKGKLEIEI